MYHYLLDYVKSLYSKYKNVLDYIGDAEKHSRWLCFSLGQLLPSKVILKILQ